MKKLACFLVLALLLTTASFAATKTIQQSGMKMGLGYDDGMAVLRFAGDTFNTSIGLMYQNQTQNNNSASTFGVGGKMTFNLTAGERPTHAGAALAYFSLPNSVSAFVIKAIYGAEANVTNNFVVGVDINPISFTSVSNNGGTTISLLTGCVYGYFYL